MAKEKTYVEVTVRSNATPLIERIEFAPVPDSVQFRNKKFVFPEHFITEGLSQLNPEQFRTLDSLRSFFDSLGGVSFNLDTKGYFVRFKKAKSDMGVEAYTLKMRKLKSERTTTRKVSKHLIHS